MSFELTDENREEVLKVVSDNGYKIFTEDQHNAILHEREKKGGDDGSKLAKERIEADIKSLYGKDKKDGEAHHEFLKRVREEESIKFKEIESKYTALQSDYDNVKNTDIEAYKVEIEDRERTRVTEILKKERASFDQEKSVLASKMSELEGNLDEYKSRNSELKVQRLIDGTLNGVSGVRSLYNDTYNSATISELESGIMKSLLNENIGEIIGKSDQGIPDGVYLLDDNNHPKFDDTKAEYISLKNFFVNKMNKYGAIGSSNNANGLGDATKPNERNTPKGNFIITPDTNAHNLLSKLTEYELSKRGLDNNLINTSNIQRDKEFLKEYSRVKGVMSK